jgi:Ca2+-binding RTX toxin-like protein
VRRLILLMAAMAAVLVVVSGVAYALSVQCDGTNDQDPDPGQCRGTNQNDVITGTAQRDIIFALAGFDQVSSLGGQDELNGGSNADTLAGGNDNDTYNGNGGPDFLDEFQDTTDSGNDLMNGGGSTDFIAGNQGNDILRGEEGDDSQSGAFFTSMFGDEGNDVLRGGPGDDGMEGQDGTDQHFGGADNDFIDAVSQDESGTQDLVDCGTGNDTARVREPEDIVRGNCEEVIEEMAITTAPDSGTTDAEQQQQAEAFLQEHGLQP